MDGNAAARERRGFALRMAVSLAAGALMFMCAVGWAATPDEAFAEAQRVYRAGDVVGAMRVVRAPAEAGHARAQALLGHLLESAGLFDEANGWYRKAAEQGDADGEFGLATALASGQGAPRDAAMARALYERAAARGHRQATEVLADAAIRGALGIAPGTRPDGGALEWIRKAAEADHLASLDFLARAWRDGTLGSVDALLAQEYAARAEKLRYPNGRPRTRRR